MQTVKDLKFEKYYPLNQEKLYAIDYSSESLSNFLKEMKNKDLDKYNSIISEINSEAGMTLKDDVLEFEYMDYTNNFKDYDEAYTNAIIEVCQEIVSNIVNDVIRSKVGKFGALKYFKFSRK